MTYVPIHRRTEAEKDALLYGKRNAKILSGEPIKERAKPTHHEADLHLAFCKWVKLQYPNDQFIRHEREGKRSWYMQNLFKIYNSDLDKMPDFECLEPVFKEVGLEQYFYCRLYIEFKRPGTTLTLKDGVTIKPEYSEQYRRHVRFWEQNSPAYFCSDLDHAIELYNAYKVGRPLPMQVFNFKELF